MAFFAMARWAPNCPASHAGPPLQAAAPLTSLYSPLGHAQQFGSVFLSWSMYVPVGHGLHVLLVVRRRLVLACLYWPAAHVKVFPRVAPMRVAASRSHVLERMGWERARGVCAYTPPASREGAQAQSLVHVAA